MQKAQDLKFEILLAKCSLAETSQAKPRLVKPSLA